MDGYPSILPHCGRSYLTTSVSIYHYQSIAPQLTHCTPFAFPLCMFEEASIGYASLKLT